MLRSQKLVYVKLFNYTMCVHKYNTVIIKPVFSSSGGNHMRLQIPQKDFSSFPSENSTLNQRCLENSLSKCENHSGTNVWKESAFFSCDKIEFIIVQKEKTACIRELSD